jgi:hypothetical protein
MAKPKDRTNTYWEARIARDYPEVFSQFRAGAIPTIRAARKAAGLLRQPTLLERMMREWDRLNHKERNEFLRWAHATYKVKSEMDDLLEPAAKDDAQLAFF